jgi:tetratricopeptide (TPR) repeat protein
MTRAESEKLAKISAWTEAHPATFEQAIQVFKKSLARTGLERCGPRLIGQALSTAQSILGNHLVKEGRWQEGLQLLLNSVTQLRTGDNPLAYANALFQTGRAYETLSDWSNARTYYRDALRLYKHLEDLPGMAKSQAGLGGVLVSQGFLEKGILALQSAGDLYSRLQKTEDAAAAKSLCQTAQRALDQYAAEICA